MVSMVGFQAPNAVVTKLAIVEVFKDSSVFFKLRGRHFS
jgi:hypothetical protein